MPANVRGASAHLRRALELVIQDSRRHVIARDQPRRLRPFLVVERILPGRNLSPAGNAAGRTFHQHHVTVRRPAEAGLEEMDQGHLDLVQRDSFYLHSHFPSWYVPACSDFSNPITANPRSKALPNS